MTANGGFPVVSRRAASGRLYAFSIPPGSGSALGLLVIVTILLGDNFRSAEHPRDETLEREQSVVHKVRGELESIRDKVVKDLPSRIPQLETPLNLLADRIKPRRLEIRNKQATRQKLWDDHPIER